MALIPTAVIEGYIPREVQAVECKCRGYAARAETTIPEEIEFGCGRDKHHADGRAKGHACCARAFVCKLCGTRVRGTAVSPDM